MSVIKVWERTDGMNESDQFGVIEERKYSQQLGGTCVHTYSGTLPFLFPPHPSPKVINSRYQS